MDKLSVPQEFLRVLALVGIDGQWRETMSFHTSRKSVNQTDRVQECLGGLFNIIRKKFNSYESFIDQSEKWLWTQGVRFPFDESLPANPQIELAEAMRELAMKGVLGWNALLSVIPSHEEIDAENDADSERSARDRLAVGQEWARQLLLSDNMVWDSRVELLETRADHLRFFAMLGVPDDKWKKSSWLMQQTKAGTSQRAKSDLGYSIFGFIQCLQRKHGSYKVFLAKMDDRLPMCGFKSEEEVLEYAAKEIRRLKALERFPGSNLDREIVTDEDFDLFLRITNVEDSIVLQRIDSWARERR